MQSILRRRRAEMRPYITSLYDKYKIYRAKFEQAWQQNIVLPSPVHIDIELNTTCNLNCTMCPFDDLHKEGRIMNPLIVGDIIEEAAEIGVSSIKFNFR